MSQFKPSAVQTPPRARPPKKAAEPPKPKAAESEARVASDFPEERGSQAALGSSGALNAEPPGSALPAFTEESPQAGQLSEVVPLGG